MFSLIFLSLLSLTFSQPPVERPSIYSWTATGTWTFGSDEPTAVKLAEYANQTAVLTKTMLSSYESDDFCSSNLMWTWNSVGNDTMIECQNGMDCDGATCSCTTTTFVWQQLKASTKMGTCLRHNKRGDNWVQYFKFDNDTFYNNICVDSSSGYSILLGWVFVYHQDNLLIEEFTINTFDIVIPQGIFTPPTPPKCEPSVGSEKSMAERAGEIRKYRQNVMARMNK